MEPSVHGLLARLAPDRRREDRRARVAEPFLAPREVFSRAEREAFRRLDRRVALRRHADMPSLDAG